MTLKLCLFSLVSRNDGRTSQSGSEPGPAQAGTAWSSLYWSWCHKGFLFFFLLNVIFIEFNCRKTLVCNNHIQIWYVIAERAAVGSFSSSPRQYLTLFSVIDWSFLCLVFSVGQSCLTELKLKQEELCLGRHRSWPAALCFSEEQYSCTKMALQLKLTALAVCCAAALP